MPLAQPGTHVVVTDLEQERATDVEACLARIIDNS
jgi:hypothetical protein